MDYSDYITWKSKLSQYTGGICPADCTSNLPSGGTGSLPAGRYFSDYLFYNNITSSWQVGSDSVHLGAKAGALGIGNSSIAIGESANARNNYSIAIGKSTNVGGTNTIALNATGSTFATDQNNSFFVSPVRPATSINVLYYDPFSKEVTYGSVPVGAGSGLPSGASKHGEYLYFNGLTWLIGSDKVSIGAGAGATSQMAGAISIGSNAGNFQQSIGAISIGIDAGKSNQGQNAVAIGSKAGTTSQHPNTVIINATGIDVNSEGPGRLYVKPVREAGGVKSLYYDVSSGEVTYDAPYDGSDIDDASQWAIFRAKQTVDMSGFRMTRLADPVADTDAVNKAYLLAQLRDASDALPLGGGTMLGDIDMSGRRLLRVGEAIASGHAVNKGYVDGGFLKLQGGIMTGNIDMSGYMLRVASDPSGATDVVNKRYLLAQLRDVSDALPLGGGTMLGDIDMSGKRLLRIAEPFNDGDVTTKNHVDTRIPLGKTYGEYIYHDGVKWAIGGTSVNLGLNAGVSENGDDTVAIGNEAGRYGQGDFSVAIGARAGQTNQADKSIIINATGMALNTDVSNAFYVAPVRENMTTKAMYYNLATKEVSYGDISGGGGTATFPDASRYGEYIYYNGSNWLASGSKVNFGLNSGRYSQSDGAVAIGWEAGKSSQSVETVAIGIGAGRSNQRDFSVAIGAYAGSIEQDSTAVAIGAYAGKLNQDKYTVAIGQLAGSVEQGLGAIAIGASAGQSNQGENAIAIGNLSGKTSQLANSIIINATGISMTADVSNAFYVKPVREKTATKALYYDVSSGEISYSDISGGVGEANGGFIGTNTLYNNQYKFRRYPYGLNINDGKTVADPLNQVTEQDTIANAFAKVDDWIHSYLIAQPPVPIQLELLKKATPTSIYLAFQNPIQIKSAVFKKKLPLIEQVNVDICNNNTPYKAFTLDTQYIPDISGITAFVISKVPVIPPYRTINLTISGESNSKEFKAYYYYNNGIAGSTATSNLVKLWYSNFSELPPNVLTALLPGFAAGSAPSVSRDLSLNAITKQTFFANWNPPIFSDLINGIQSIDFDSPLLSYIFKYKGVNSVRYGGVLNTTEFTSASLTNSELNLPFSGAIVHPGTNYNVSVFAYNNTIATPSPELSGSLITLYPTAPPMFSTKNISFSTNYLYTPGIDVIAKVIDNSGITYPVLKDYVNASSSTITNIVLHKYSGVFNTDKIINTGNNIMKLYGIYHNDLYGDVSFNEYTFNGFGGLLPSSVGNTTDVQLAYNNLGDYYGAGNNENNGFYLTTDAYVQIKPKSISVKNLVASTQYYYINLYQKQNNDAEVFLRSNFFYLDDISSVPIINKCELQYNSSNFIKISGVNILNTPININTITDISNIASYYYVKTKLINYKLYNDDNNSLLTNIDLSDIDNEKSNYSAMTTMKDYPFKFDKVELNMNYNNVFSKRIRLEIKARNLIGTSSDYKLYKNILIDTESVRNIALYNMTDVPTLDYVSKSGRLNKTDVNGVIDFDEFSNFRAKYDLSESLLNNTTLQIFNGNFSTKSVSNNAYLDYSELNIDFNNGINYSGISSTGYRYATFAWKVTNFSPAYSGRIVFSIKNIGGSVHMPTIDTQNGVTLNGVPLLFYYRVENINNPTVLERNKTTVWINANRVSSGSLMADSDKNTDLAFNLALGGRYQSNANNSIYVENNDLIYDVFLFDYLNSNIETNTHVYATIGIPMAASFLFKHMEAYLIQ